jgi:lipopolysaccharide transport system ATP-binding protein
LEVGTGFHPELTGRENVFLNGAILGMSRAEIRMKFDEIVAFAEVEKFLDTPVKRYSSGMYVRLAFAVAAHLEPEILIVDEVLAVGDAQFQEKCLGKMQDVAKGGRTVLFVSHNMNAVERLCRRVLHLDRGHVAGDYAKARSGIMAYVRGDSQGAVFIWRNSGKEYQNTVFVPQTLEAASEAPGWSPGEAFSNAYPIVISISGLIHTDDPALNIGIGLYDEKGTALLWSFMKDVPKEQWPDSRPGFVAFKICIPPRWLNECDYRVELLAGLHCRSWSLEPGVFAPSIIFSIQGGLSDSPLWDFKRPGLLGPVIPWLRVPSGN